MSIAVVSGVGPGTGRAVSLAFAALSGYSVALVGRDGEYMRQVAGEIISGGGPGGGTSGSDSATTRAAVFSLESYERKEVERVFREIQQTWPDKIVKAAVYNAARWSRAPFMDLDEAEIKRSMEVNVIGAFSFARSVIGRYLEHGQGGTLIFTSATSAIRGSEGFAAFAAGKHGLRALSQSLAREFGRQNIHVASVIVDGMIQTPRVAKMIKGTPMEESMADDRRSLNPETIAKAYIYLHLQEGSWTNEMDLRPAHEKF